LLALMRTRGCSWLGCVERSNAAVQLRRCTCQAVADDASIVLPASRHGLATRAMQARRVIISGALRQLVRTAMCETV
jgi:hypothetical protein